MSRLQLVSGLVFVFGNLSAGFLPKAYYSAVARMHRYLSGLVCLHLFLNLVYSLFFYGLQLTLSCCTCYSSVHIGKLVTMHQSTIYNFVLQASWTESKPKLEKDPQGRALNPDLGQGDAEKLFRDHVKDLYEVNPNVING